MRTALYLSILLSVYLAISFVVYLASAIVLPQFSNAQDITTDSTSAEETPAPLRYVGSNFRVGANLDTEGDASAELLGVFGFNGKKAYLAETYAGDKNIIGVKLGYHRLMGTGDDEASEYWAANAWVFKLLAGIDQNSFRDQKATLGVGVENNNNGLNIYYSRGINDERLESSQLTSQVVNAPGSVITTTTQTELFGQPYDEGFGFRVEHFFDEISLRLRGGLDFQRGDNLLNGDSATQIGGNIGVEKFFYGSRHSLGLDLNYSDKTGPFDGAEFEQKKNNLILTLQWRYAFGENFRADIATYRDVEVAPVAVAAPEPKIIQNELSFSSESLFELNKSALTQPAKNDLNSVISTLKQKSVGQIKIVGHTCDIGASTYNQDLSKRRADAVAAYLLENGIAAETLDVSGAGEQAPKVPNNSSLNRMANRRIELSFISIEKTLIQSEVVADVSTWKRERVTKNTDAWISRALRNLPAHSRTVDTYRAQEKTITSTNRSVDRSAGPITINSQTINSQPNTNDAGTSP